MKNMNGNKEKCKLIVTLIIVGVLAIAVPIIIEIMGIIPNSKPSDFLGFWSSYLGVIMSGIIAFGVARYQIQAELVKQKQKDIEKELPYFNIGGEDSCPIIVSSISNLPLMNMKLTYGEKGDDTDKVKNLGHVFPNMKSPFDFKRTPSWIDIQCRTCSGTEIFFTYSNDLNGCCAWNDEKSKEWQWYAKAKVFDEAKANKRLYNRLKK